MSLVQIIGLLVMACVFATVFALGLNATWRDITYLAGKPGLLARSLLAAYVLTPLIAVVLVKIFAAPAGVEIGVLLLAISAGAPVLPKKLIKFGGSPRYIYSLDIFMALIAIFTVPASVAILGPLFPGAWSVSPLQVATLLTTRVFVPLLAGIAVRSLWPKFAQRFGSTLMAAASIVLLGIVLLVLVTNFSMLRGLGFQSLLIMVLLTCGALAVGHISAGPDPNERTTLALACATRFPALAMLIASLNFPNAKPLPIVVAYVLTSNLTVIPYLRWRKKQRDAEKAGPSEAAA